MKTTTHEIHGECCELFTLIECDCDKITMLMDVMGKKYAWKALKKKPAPESLELRKNATKEFLKENPFASKGTKLYWGENASTIMIVGSKAYIQYSMDERSVVETVIGSKDTLREIGRDLLDVAGEGQ